MKRKAKKFVVCVTGVVLLVMGSSPSVGHDADVQASSVVADVEISEASSAGLTISQGGVLDGAGVKIHGGAKSRLIQTRAYKVSKRIRHEVQHKLVVPRAPRLP